MPHRKGGENIMYPKVFNLLVKVYPVICSLVVTTSTLSTNECVKWFYQEKEPEGLAEFVKQHRNKR